MSEKTLNPSKAAKYYPLLVVAGIAAFIGMLYFGFSLYVDQQMSRGTAQGMPADHPPVQASPDNHQAQIEGMVARLAEKMKTDPDNPGGWAMLARSYAVLGKYQEAVQAFEKAAALSPNDANLLADFADAAAMSQARSLQGKPLQLIQAALKIDPEHVKSLALAGSEAFARNDYAAALDFWKRALRAAGPGSEWQSNLQASIADAEARLKAK